MAIHLEEGKGPAGRSQPSVKARRTARACDAGRERGTADDFASGVDALGDSKWTGQNIDERVGLRVVNESNRSGGEAAIEGVSGDQPRVADASGFGVIPTRLREERIGTIRAAHESVLGETGGAHHYAVVVDA